jgi:hypothetical protein
MYVSHIYGQVEYFAVDRTNMKSIQTQAKTNAYSNDLAANSGLGLEAVAR